MMRCVVVVINERCTFDDCIFCQVLEMAEKGNSTTVDMLVKDIYGGQCEKVI